MFLEYNKEEKTLTGEFLCCDIPTLSGKIYPKIEVEKSLIDYQKVIDNEKAVGVLVLNPDHTYSNILIDNIAVLVIELHFNKNKLYGTFKILNTHDGNLLIGLLNTNCKFKTIMSATGNIIYNVVTNLQIISFNVIKQ
jgi:hypothetical protein